MNKNSVIYVAGHKGLVGSAILRKLNEAGFQNVITAQKETLDLRNRESVLSYFEENKPEYVFLAAAKVGGILANKNFPADFIFDNLSIELNIIEAAHRSNIKKLLFLGSSCIYPKFAEQPIKESSLMTGALEPTNDAYAIAKIAGIKMCDAYREQYGSNFISVMPTNLYGINDNFDPENSHVLPALIQRFHKAKIENKKEVVCWGTGSPMREFLYVDDLAEACVFLMENYNENGILNIGTGIDVTIKELTEIVAKIIGFEGSILWDKTKPDGTQRKLLDVSKIHSLGWKHKTDLADGISKTYDWYKQNY